MSADGTPVFSIEVQGVDFSYGDVPVLRQISAHIAAPCVCALLGSSGIGKSTLLRLIAGAIQPSSGRILVRPTGAAPFAWVPQDAGLFAWLTARQNMEFPLTLASNRNRPLPFERTPDINAIAQELNIGQILERFPNAISGGQKQRVAIGRALAARARVLLMDEPFSALDPQTRAEVRVLIRGVSRVNKMITIVATHDLLDAAFISDRVFVLNGARPAGIVEVTMAANESDGERAPPDALTAAGLLGQKLQELSHGA